MGILGRILTIFISAVVSYLNNPTLPYIQIAFNTFGVTLVVFIAFVLFDAIFSVPYERIKEQNDNIVVLKGVQNKKEAIKFLEKQRKEGVNLRNQGMNILHNSRIDSWWEDHTNWRKKTKDGIAILDKSMDMNWYTLNTFEPKREFANAINIKHRKYLQMFDEWLDRLDRVILSLR